MTKNIKKEKGLKAGKGLQKKDVSATGTNSLQGSSSAKRFKMSFLVGKNLFTVLPLIIFIVLYTSAWILPEPQVIDPWYKAIKLIDSSKKVSDPTYKNQLIEQAGKELKQLLSLHPYHARLYYFMGYYFYHTGNWDSSIAYEKKAIKMDSGSVWNKIDIEANDLIIEAYLNKSRILATSNQIEKAKEALLETLPYKPTDFNVYKNLGNIYFIQNLLDSATYFYKQAISYKTDDADIYNNIGIIASKFNKLSEARQYFEKALQINPDYKESIKNLNNLTGGK